MGEYYDEATTEQTLAAGNSLSLSVDTTGRDSDVVVFVDNGTSGSNAATFDLVAEVDDGDGTMRQFGSDTGTTSLSFTDSAVPKSMTYTLTNQSGASATYRVRVVSYR